MKTPVMKHPLRLFTILMAVVLLGTACKKDKKSGFPRTVSIEYKVSSNSGLSTADITFTNESGGLTDVDNASLPFSRTISKTLNEAQAIGLNGSKLVAGHLKLEIIVDGKSVVAQDFTQSPVISAIVQHTFY
ncbi:MAG: hypothetical protein ACTHMC_11975 [Pseudobacter sp.]|uniref:hypothetical protein n=1 Tax=Pseudobacter sp. TaxID=2045420 RepID=UPI003F7CDEB8